MTETSAIVAIQEYAPNGLEDDEAIFARMLNDLNDDKEYKENKVIEIYNNLISEKSEVPDFSDITEECNKINGEAVQSLALNCVLEDLHCEKKELTDISTKDFATLIEDKEYSIWDSLSYNMQDHVESDVLKLINKAKICVAVTPYDIIYEDLFYGYDSQIADNISCDIILNHAQQVMFNDLVSSNNFDSILYKYGEMLIEKEA